VYVCEFVAFELLLYLSYMGYIDCLVDKYMRFVVEVALVHRIDLVLCNVRCVGPMDKIDGDIALDLDRTASLFERRPAFEHSFDVIVAVGVAVVVKVLMAAVLVHILCTVVVETMVVVVVRKRHFVIGHRVHLHRRRLQTCHMAFAAVDLFVDFVVVFVEAED
jgi:hypothetical protein